MGILMLSGVPLEFPSPTGDDPRRYNKDAGTQATLFKETKLLPLKPLHGWRNLTKETSRGAPVGTASAFQAVGTGTGRSICELPFLKAR